MKNLLYFFPRKTSFISADADILSKKYTVLSFSFKPSPKWLAPYYFLAQFIFIIFKLPWTKVMFSQFSGYHTFLPALFSKLFKIPHYIVLNGTECNNFPEINYGFIHQPLLFWFSKKSLQWSTRLFPVSESLISAEYTYTSTKYKLQGYTHFYKNINTPCTTIHNGISIEQFNIDPSIQRAAHSFVTVAGGLETSNRRLVKGLDLVIELAKMTPEHHYTFIGAHRTTGLGLPSNVSVMGLIPHHQLSSIYNRHQFYLQLSMTEGFGISVCEAMLCGCVPIVSDVGILPAIAGENGYVLHQKNVDLLSALVKQAISAYNPDHSDKYRQHIIDHYSLALREEKLLESIK